MSRELQSVVDEEDPLRDDEFHEEPPQVKEKDWDKICAYKTFRVVRIRDRYLGMVYWSIVTLIILYIIIFALGMEGKHQYQEPGIGTVITRYHGKAFANKKAYDMSDLRFPEIEPFGAFIMTKEVKIVDQEVGECVDFDNPCPCREGAQCVDGFCKEKAWCPSLGDGNEDFQPESAEGAEVTTMTGLEHTKLSILAGIAFPGLGNHFFVAGKKEAPPLPPGVKPPPIPLEEKTKNKFQDITLGDLLSQAQPPVKLEEVIDKGALIAVSFFWTCDVADLGCQPGVVIKRLDNGKGFSQKRAFHHSEGGASKRDAVLMYGLRILVESSGIGRQFSFVLLVIQIGSCLALLRTASMSADFMMLSLYPKVRRETYQNLKVEETRDYSDLQDRINLVQESQEEEGLLRARGDDVPKGTSLGLGVGSRGGLAKNILRTKV